MKLFVKAHYNKKLGIKEEAELEQAAVKNLENFGAAKDLFHPDFGWLLKDNKLTEVGIKFFQKYYPGS